MEIPQRSAAAAAATGAASLLQGPREPTTEDALDEETAVAREAEHLRNLVFRLRQSHPEEAELRTWPIGLAISGGGTRAAAFHTGVFWSLASSGLLKEVEHLCAVSGGGYTAASYVSHLCHSAMQSPPTGTLDDWYREVVASFVLRMQRNINYVVDITPDRLWRPPRGDVPEDSGSSCCPRILDFPLFIGALLGSMTASPLLLVLHTLWPFVFCIELAHGAMLRRAWCDPSVLPHASKELSTWFWQSTVSVAGLAVLAIVLGALIGGGVCPRTRQRHRAYLCCRSLRHVLERGAICFAVYVLAVAGVLGSQALTWGTAAEDRPTGAWVRALCHHYVAGAGPRGTCSDLAADSGRAWYESGGAARYLDEAWSAVHAAPPPGAPEWGAGVPFHSHGPQRPSLFAFLAASVGASGMVLIGVGALVWRCKLAKWLATIVVPLGYFLLVVQVARWKVFGPITRQMLLPPGAWSHHSTRLANVLFWVCAAGAILTLPVYDAVQKLAHLYYRRALKRAFFWGGRDVNFASIVSNPYCPNLLFGACVHDYRKPWEGQNYIDFTISTLFIGCARTGFFCNQPQASLARLMAVAGAATDATFLLNADVLAIRFFLAVIALRFGDFLRLLPDGPMSIRVEGRIADTLERQLPANSPSLHDLWDQQHWISRWLQGLMDRLPAACPFFVAHMLLLVGATVGGTSPEGAPACATSRALVWTALAIYCAVAALSFFAHLRSLQWLMRSPMIQQFLMLFMHRYKALRPPPYLYISDGGLIEPLGLFPLLRRRLARIVVSDAAEDPELSMRCLRDACGSCRREGLCSFYDPRDPCRDLEFVLQDFRGGRTGFLHLGIRYEEAAGRAGAGAAASGELFYVRMRLLPGDDAPVRGLLTRGELLAPPPEPGRGPADPGAGLRRELGGACIPACECGGLCAGRRFPHFGVGNQFLTPGHFANLSGLGAELSRPLVQKMLEARRGGTA